jgi:hypothetical protein
LKHGCRLTNFVVTSIITPSLRASSTSSPTLPSTSTIIPNIPDTGGGGSHSNIGAIAGGVVGGLAVIGIVVIVLFWIRHPKQKVDAQLEDQKTNDTGDGAAMYAQASLVAKLDAGPMHATSELDARGNEINELDAGKKWGQSRHDSFEESVQCSLRTFLEILKGVEKLEKKEKGRQ